MLEKPQINLGSHEIIINLMRESLREGEQYMQEHLYEHFYSDEHNGFLVAITLIDKTDDKILKIGKPNG